MSTIPPEIPQKLPVDAILEALVVADLVAEPAALLEEDAQEDRARGAHGEVGRRVVGEGADEEGGEDGEEERRAHLVDVEEEVRLEEASVLHLEAEPAVALLEVELLLALGALVAPLLAVLLLELADEERREVLRRARRVEQRERVRRVVARGREDDLR